MAGSHSWLADVLRVAYAVGFSGSKYERSTSAVKATYTSMRVSWASFSLARERARERYRTVSFSRLLSGLSVSREVHLIRGLDEWVGSNESLELLAVQLTIAIGCWRAIVC